MQKGLKINGQFRALAIALGGAILTSVIAMLIPVSVFESITGATGFSELVPATGAPLGDTARALIAFGFGAIAFAALAMYLLRRPPVGSDIRSASQSPSMATPVAEPGVSLIDKAKAKVTDFVESRRNPDAVKELSDLPKLRAGDAHPDAPPRRPISAHRDFGEVDTGVPAVAEPVITVAAAPVVEARAAETVGADVVEQAAEPTPTNAATVTNMVDRLEWAVAERQEQIAKLEALAVAENSKPELPVEVATAVDDVAVEVAAVPAPKPEPTPEIIAPGTRPSILSQPNMSQSISAQPVLEVVASEPATELVEDDMDAALRSALETLHRMNARTR